MGRELCQKDSCRSATFLTELGWFSVILVISFWVCNVMLMSAPNPNKKRVVFWESGNLPHIFLQVDESGGYFLGKWEGFSSFPKPYQLTYSKFTYAKRWKAGSFYFKVLPIPKRKGSCFFFDRSVFWQNQQLLRVILLLNWWRSNAGSPRIFKTNTATNWNDWINCLRIKQVPLEVSSDCTHQNWLGKTGCLWLEGKLTMYNVKISDFGLFLGHTISAIGLTHTFLVGSWNFLDTCWSMLIDSLILITRFLFLGCWFQTCFSIETRNHCGMTENTLFSSRERLGTLDSRPTSYASSTPNPPSHENFRLHAP